MWGNCHALHGRICVIGRLFFCDISCLGRGMRSAECHSSLLIRLLCDNLSRGPRYGWLPSVRLSVRPVPAHNYRRNGLRKFRFADNVSGCECNSTDCNVFGQKGQMSRSRGQRNAHESERAANQFPLTRSTVQMSLISAVGLLVTGYERKGRRFSATYRPLFFALTNLSRIPHPQGRRTT